MQFSANEQLATRVVESALSDALASAALAVDAETL
jgi:hypothetical protein